MQMSLKHSKTIEEVSTHLNDTAIKILGEQGDPKKNMFELPTANGANKTLKAWVKRAKIEKKITWHNGRHSFGTNLIFNNVDILTTSELFGQTSVKHTQRYVKASEEMKERATDSININM
jgi:integrase/recombinase XerD